MPQDKLTRIAFWIIGGLVLVDTTILALTGIRLARRALLGVVMGAILLDILGRVYAGPRDAPRLALCARLGMRIVLFSAAAETFAIGAIFVLEFDMIKFRRIRLASFSLDQAESPRR